MVNRFCSNFRETEEVDLQFIDYGLSEVRSWEQVVADVDAKFLSLPRMAYMCSLADVKPVSMNTTFRGRDSRMYKV